MDRIALCGGELLYRPDFFPRTEADEHLRALRHTIPWEQHRITVYGRQVPVPRLSAWCGDPEARYAYSGLALEPRPWTRELHHLKERVEEATGTSFNAVLLNLYRDGSDSMGWHSDDEPELGLQPTIASLSFGQARRFLLRRKDRREEKVELELGHGSLLVMSGPTQKYWQHQVPRTRRPAQERLNLTFRYIEGACPS